MADTPALPTAVAGSSAEAQAAAFAEDDRIHFDRTTGTWRVEDDDGNEWEYDAAKAVWVQVVRAIDEILYRCAINERVYVRLMKIYCGSNKLLTRSRE